MVAVAVMANMKEGAMSFQFTRLVQLVVSIISIYSSQSFAEIYQWVDSEGRQQFSDSPKEEYSSVGYASSVKSNALRKSDSKNSKELEDIAKDFKKDRLKREKIREKENKARVLKNKKREKKLAAVKKRKLACKKAKKKEDLAFRQRIQRKSLSNMRKALANYEKKRATRIEKCK